MKRTMIIAMLCCAWFVLFAQPVFQVNFGIDTASKLRTNQDDISDFETRVGFSPSFEIMGPVLQNMLVGAGVEYQLQRGVKGDEFDNVKYGFIPFFAVVKFDVNRNHKVTPELIAHLGYSIFSGNNAFRVATSRPVEDDASELAGGFYWAGGIGVAMQHGVVLQILYRGFQADETFKATVIPGEGGLIQPGREVHLRQDQLTAQIGVRF